MSSENIPKVFISYSWAVQKKTLELAERLLASGINVIIDVYDLKDGQDKYAFMEQSVNDPTVDHVLIICDKTYTEKANNREGGVGDETVIITSEIYGDVEQTKFIPVIFEKDEDGKAYCPQYIKSRIYVDLSDENNYESEYEKLLRDLYHKPLFRKPALGRRPEWLDSETVDLSAIRDAIKQIKGLPNSNSGKANFLLRRTIDDFINAAKQYKITGKKDLAVEFPEIIDQSKNYRDLFVEYINVLIYNDFKLSDTLIDFFEQLYNGLYNATENNGCTEHDFEFPRFIVWEFFIDMTALLLYFEKYRELHDILEHQFFLRTYPNYNDFRFDNYSHFRTYFQIIEDICKPKSKEPRLFTLAGNIIVSRENRPAITKRSIWNADLVLYQLSRILKSSNDQWCASWFPMTYIYFIDTPQTIWQKLKSKKYCLKIAPLLGVNSVIEIKNIVLRSPKDSTVTYNGAMNYAPGILSSISVEEIGTLP